MNNNSIDIDNDRTEELKLKQEIISMFKSMLKAKDEVDEEMEAKEKAQEEIDKEDVYNGMMTLLNTMVEKLPWLQDVVNEYYA